ncbi:unnamed protein product, partial [Porites evermanni]
MLLCVLHGEDGQWEDINESTDEEAKEGGTEDDSKGIGGSGDDESEEDIVLGELSSGPDSEQDAASGEREFYSINKSDKIWFVFQSDSEEEKLYVFPCLADSTETWNIVLNDLSNRLANVFSTH